MEKLDEHIDAYIARHLAGETTPEEDAALQAWVAKSPDNRRYFDDLQAIWDKSPAMRPAASRPVDTEAALEKVRARLRDGGGALRPLTVRMNPLWRAAAAVLLVVTAAYFIWLRNTPGPATVIAATDTALTDTLTDGSVIALSPQSGLTLAKNFNTRERRVRLRGEARFKVSSDTTRPFVVEMADLEVRVVGTEFNVDNTDDTGSVSVTVAEGKVRVSARGQSLLLQAGEGALYDKKSGTLARTVNQQNPPQNRLLRFTATPLREVVQQVEKMYGVKVTLKNKTLEGCLLTARYNNLTPNEVLDLVAESFSLQLTKAGSNEYVLDGTGCGE